MSSNSYNLTNAITIGANSIVPSSNQMILGNNDVNVGIGLSGDISVSTGPQKKLEIDAGLNGTLKVADNVVGASGLRFRDLHSGTDPIVPNTSGKVLSVNSDGDVILVNDAVGSGTVTSCTTAVNANHLTKWDGSDIICNTIVYEENNSRIGIDVFNALQGKLHVQNSTENVGAFVSTRGSITSNPRTGVYGIAHNSSLLNIGTRGTVPLISLPVVPPRPTPMNIGVLGQATSGGRNYGGYFEALGSGSFNYGVYANAKSISGYSGYFQGNIIANTAVFPSDINLKDSIENLTGALNILSQLTPKSFVFKTDSFPYMNFDTTRQYGFISQAVDSIIPWLVHDIHQPEIFDTNGTLLMDTFTFKGLNYTGLIPLLAAGVNELNTTKVSACTPTDSNYVPKWDAVNNVLCATQIYENSDGLVGIALTDTDELGEARLTVHGGTGLAGIHAEGDTVGAVFTGGMAGVYAFTDSVTTSHAGVIGVSQNATVTNIGVIGVAGEGIELPGPEDEPVNVGVAAFSQLPTAGKSVGVMTIANSSSSANTGVFAIVEEEADTAINAGVIAFAAGSDGFNVGGLFGAEDSTGINFGIFASASGSDSSMAAHFAGDIEVTGAIYETSDQKLKTNIASMDNRNALAAINALQPKSYEYRTEDYKTLSLEEGVQHGLVAQDVEQVLPELVRTLVQPEIKDHKGRIISEKMDYKGVNYIGLLPYVISAMQAQQATIEEQQGTIDSLSAALKGRLANIESIMNECCAIGYRQSGEDTENGNEEANRVTVELSSLQVVILEQNVPNPFKEQTSISYFIPEESAKAQMLFFDVKGRMIKSVELEKGYGIMTVFAQNLSSGTYSYSLVINGEVVETKRMVKMK